MHTSAWWPPLHKHTTAAVGPASADGTTTSFSSCCRAALVMHIPGAEHHRLCNPICRYIAQSLLDLHATACCQGISGGLLLMHAASGHHLLTPNITGRHRCQLQVASKSSLLDPDTQWLGPSNLHTHGEAHPATWQGHTLPTPLLLHAASPLSRCLPLTR